MKKICRFVFLTPATLLALLCLASCKSHPEPQVFTAPTVANPIVPSPRAAIQPARTTLIDTNLFNGKNLSGWKITDFGGHGEILVENGAIKIEMGAELTGIHWTNAAILPNTNYEIELDAMKREGGDFFCALTFPVSNSFCSLIVGGWGGSVVGLSSLDGMDASENDTSRSLYFEKDRWFHIRLQVQPEKIVVWIDQEKIIDVGIAGRKVAMRTGEIMESMPLGIATWQTSASVKNIRLKTL